MTAFNYARTKASADRLIARFGQSGWLRQMIATGSAPYNPDRRTKTDYDATFAVIDFTTAEIDGSRILATDKKVLMSPEVQIDPAPALKLVEADGTVYEIVTAQPLKPAGTVLLWTLQVRK